MAEFQFNHLQIVMIYSALGQVTLPAKTNLEDFLTAQDVLRKFRLPLALRKAVAESTMKDPDPDEEPEFPVVGIELDRTELKCLRDRLTDSIPYLVPMVARRWFPQTMKMIADGLNSQ